MNLARIRNPRAVPFLPSSRQDADRRVWCTERPNLLHQSERIEVGASVRELPPEQSPVVGRDLRRAIN
jgi:hypothetical protein